MGQDQSTQGQQGFDVAATSSGVQLVQGSGQAVRPRVTAQNELDGLLEKSKALPLPQPLLPPPPVKDDMSSALQGAQMMHELRTVLGGLLLGMEDNYASSVIPESATPSTNDGDAIKAEKEEGQGNSNGVEAIVGNLERRPASINEFSESSPTNIRAEQEKWGRLGIDFEALNAVIEQCTGGKNLTVTLARQEELQKQIILVREQSVRLRDAMDANSEQAKRTTMALERLDRIHVSLSGVQDSLESAVATANILGASHFAHDDEMCSFKSFLKHNPPRFE